MKQDKCVIKLIVFLLTFAYSPMFNGDLLPLQTSSSVQFAVIWKRHSIGSTNWIFVAWT